MPDSLSPSDLVHAAYGIPYMKECTRACRDDSFRTVPVYACSDSAEAPELLCHGSHYTSLQVQRPWQSVFWEHVVDYGSLNSWLPYRHGKGRGRSYTSA
jgi:hypothetical protein